jgi:hypothetical protein
VAVAALGVVQVCWRRLQRLCWRRVEEVSDLLGNVSQMRAHRRRGDEAFQKSDLGCLMLFQDREGAENSLRFEVPEIAAD